MWFSLKEYTQLSDTLPEPIVAPSASDAPRARAEAIAAALRAEILALRLAPHAPLHEEPLALRFGASRTPVREALRSLMQAGLVERHSRFYRVIRLSEQQARELCELREALECATVSLCTRRDGPAAARALEEILTAQRAARDAGDAERFDALDRAFHARIAEGAGNAALAAAVAAQQDRVQLLRAMERGRPHWPDRTLAEHARIQSAIARGEAEIAAAEMRAHIRSVLAGRLPAARGCA